MGGGGGGSAFGGATGVFRLFQSEFGGQVSWLIPAALLSLAALLWVSRRAPRTSRVRAFALLWGGWLLVTGLVFSYMQGIIHPYYMVALAPAIGALVGVGAISLLRSDTPLVGRAVAAAGILGTGVWAYVLLDRTPTWLPWLRWTVLLAGLLGAAAVFAVPAFTRGAASRLGGPRSAAMLAYAPLTLALVAGLGGPLAYSLDTANTTHTGSIPSAGPTVAGAFGGPGGGGPGGNFGGARTGTGGRFAGTGTGTGTGAGAGSASGTGNAAGGVPGGGTGGTGTAPGGTGGFPGGTGTGSTGTGSTGTGTGTGGRTSAPTAGSGSDGATGAGGGMGGLSGSTQVSSALIKLLEQDASQYKWIAATEGSQSAAPIELATGGDAVMAIGGFNGTDPSPTLAQFEAMVAKHEIHYFVGQSNNSFGGGTGSSSITSWVARPLQVRNRRRRHRLQPDCAEVTVQK